MTTRARIVEPQQLDLLADRRTRVVNVKADPGIARDPRYVYCGRRRGKDPRLIRPGELGSFGNPWDVREFPDALKRFEEYAADRLKRDYDFTVAVRKLRGKLLGCHCVRPDGGGACHAKFYVWWLESATD